MRSAEPACFSGATQMVNRQYRVGQREPAIGGQTCGHQSSDENRAGNGRHAPVEHLEIGQRALFQSEPVQSPPRIAHFDVQQALLAVIIGSGDVKAIMPRLLHQPRLWSERAMAPFSQTRRLRQKRPVADRPIAARGHEDAARPQAAQPARTKRAPGNQADPMPSRSAHDVDNCSRRPPIRFPARAVDSSNGTRPSHGSKF